MDGPVMFIIHKIILIATHPDPDPAE